MFFRVAFYSLVAISLSVKPAVALDEASGDADKKNGDIERITVRIQITNTEDEPVVGASVTPVGMRTRVERGSHYSWVTERHGKRPVAETDDAGMVEIPCPKFVYEQLEAGEITWQIEHEDYIVFREDLKVDDDPATVTLKRGRRIAIAAIDADTGEKLTENVHAILSGGGGSKEWNLTEAGMLMSRGVDVERPMLRVFHLPNDGPIRFSDPIDLTEYGKKLRVLLRDVKLHRGTRVEGRIDETVPRPILNGTVSINVTNGLHHESWQARNTWSDWTTISEDGTFAFDSLPPGCVAQMIAVCDGWVCSPPAQEDIDAVGLKFNVGQMISSRVLPQVAALDGDVISPVIKMEPTASCQVTVLAPDGTPLEGAMVATNPNQMWLGRGSQIVGDGYSVSAGLKLTEAQRKEMWNWEKRKQLAALGVRSPGSDRYMKTSGPDGVVVIDTLPGGAEGKPKSASIGVMHELYEQPVSDDQRMRRNTSVMMIQGETAKITIKMDKKGTNVIGK